MFDTYLSPFAFEGMQPQEWRYTYAAGQDFVNLYLKPLSGRETPEQLAARKEYTFCPAFAQQAVDEIKNAIVHCLPNVTRIGGPQSYQEAIRGYQGGVDLCNTSMNMFIGAQVLAELLTMRVCGVLVDNAADVGVTIQDKGNKHPYFQVYRREDILSWTPFRPVHGYDKLLLREHYTEVDDETGFPLRETERRRYYERLSNGQVLCRIGQNNETLEEFILNIPEIPFYLFELPKSLLHNVARYQIALMNIESSDISYILRANYPFYYEFYDPRNEAAYVKQTNPDGKAISGKKEVETGTIEGRRFPLGVSQPGFATPPSATLEASMRKAAQLKDDIRALVHLNLRQVKAGQVQSDRSLEASLAYIGTVLEQGENVLAKYWIAFEDRRSALPRITYPQSYHLETDESRLEWAERMRQLALVSNSRTYQKELAKLIVRRLISPYCTESKLAAIDREIDSQQILATNPNVLLRAQDQGLLADATAAEALLLDPGGVQQAKKDHAERLKLVIETQGGLDKARGVPGTNKEINDDKPGKQKIDDLEA